MNEVQRQQYLEAIGIDSYMPRWILPVAPAPVACAPVISMPAADTAATPATPVAQLPAAVQAKEGAGRAPAPPGPVSGPAASTPPAGSAAEALAVFSETAAPAPATAAVSALVATVAKTVAKESRAATGADPRFSLSMWRASQDLLVIDSRQAQLALPTEPLLANILLALGMPRQPLPRAEVLHWPMYDHPLSPKGEAAARETLLAMLEARLEQQPASYLLLMGAEACHYLVPGELLPDEHPQPDASYQALAGKALRIDAINATAIVVPSLSDMLKQPELKATTWRAIQPLRQL